MFLGEGPKEDTVLVYDPNEKLSYGSWRCPECGSYFLDNGKALHNTDCTRDGYDNLEYHFGDGQVARAKEMAARYGETFAWYGISVALLREKMPQLV